VARAAICMLACEGTVSSYFAQAERLISTAVLSFVVSEAAGRFRRQDHAVVDEDFAELRRWLRAALLSAAPDGPAW
jgi:hypothetical protein